MDIGKLLKGVKDLCHYQTLTKELIGEYKNDEIPLNMTIILSLKNLRNFELEFFKKHGENGGVFIIIERMLALPPSKTWKLLGKELISLIQYWLDAVRSYLLNHHVKWWDFLDRVLGFIKDLAKLKLHDNLLKETAESLLDLATRGRPDTEQRYAILHTFNLVCAESSRKMRLVFRDQIDPYLVRLGTLLTSCGHAATQLSICEAWQRWQLPRNQTARIAAANRWLPPHLYRRTVREKFLDNGWENFQQDSRDFLNVYNENSELVTSVICIRLCVGDLVLISGTERRQSYLDINFGNKSVTVMLDPKITGTNACEALTVGTQNALSAVLRRESTEMTLTILTSYPPLLQPSNILPTLPKSGQDGQENPVCVRAVLKGRAKPLNVALKAVFGEKYEVSLDPDSLAEDLINEEEAGPSDASEIKRPTHSGFMVRPKGPQTWKSPSSVSTTSLAHLYDDLTSLPRYEFDKEPVSVCAQPKLSRVSELSEVTERNSLGSASTLKLKPLATGQKTYRNYVKENNNNKSQSDGELKSKKNENTKEFNFVPRETNAKSDTEVKNRMRTLSPVLQDEKSTSCLLVATIGSADESVINDTLERLPNDATTDNIVDLLVQEALRDKTDEKDNDKGNKVLDFTDALKNSQIDFNTNAQNCTVVSKSTSDESNTEAVINDTPMTYVNVRRKTFQRKVSTRATEKDNLTLDVQAVEDFFSQHVSENQAGEMVISPTLAKKINESSSDTSEDFDQYLISNKEFNLNVRNYEPTDKDVLDTLNYVLDTVCIEIETCCEYLNTDSGVDIATIEKSVTSPRKSVERETKPKVIKNRRVIQKDKATSKVNKKQKTKKQNKNKAKGKLDLEPVSKMSTIIETIDENNQTVNKKSSDNSDELDKPLLKRKRKLYSPKDDEIVPDDVQNEIDDVILKFNPEDTTKTYNVVTPKSTATSYKEIETVRQENRIRMKKSKLINQLSPKTKKLNDVFNQLKDTVDSDVQITVADKRNSKNAVYNFSSDSDDEDFKKKKIEPVKRASTTTIESGNSVLSTRRGRKVNRINYKEKKESSDDNPEVKPARKPVKRKGKAKVEKMVEEEPVLVDEKMREAPQDVLNTSFVHDKPTETENVEVLKPAIIAPEVELITEEENKRKKPVKTAHNKKEKAKLEIEMKDKDDDRTISPLPGLVVETETKEMKGLDDSLSTNFVDKCKKMFKEGIEACEVTLQTNTTHNLLSDFDKSNNFVDIVDEGNNTFNNNENSVENFNNDVLPIYTDISDFEQPKPTEPKETSKVRAPNKRVKPNPKIKKEYDSDKENATTTKPKKPSIDTGKSKEVAIDLTELTDVTNKIDRKTISSIEITAHGVSDEEPPMNLSETNDGIPRELEDMDEDLKQYYLTLKRSIEKDASKSSSVESKTKSPVVYLTRLSTEEMTRWSEKMSEHSVEIRQWLPSNKSSTSEESRRSPDIVKRFLSSRVSIVKDGSQKSSDVTPKVLKPRKSVISPIKLFEPTFSRPKERVLKEQKKYTLESSNRPSTSSVVTKSKEKIATEKFEPKKYFLRNNRAPSTTSHMSILSSSTRKEEPKDKKRLMVEKEEERPKRRKIESDTDVVTGSSAQSSSVDDWFRRNEPIHRQAPNIDQYQSIDVIQNIMERINTTLVESHHNTEKKFIDLIMNTQQKLVELEANCHQLYKDTATDLLQTMAKTLDDKFAELDDKSKKIKETFMNDLKQRAIKCIREDRKQKQDLLTLLHDDVDAARVQIERNARTNTEES